MSVDLNKILGNVTLSESETVVLKYLVNHLDTALEMGVRGVARECYTSTSTVMRLAKKLGYDGFIDMYYQFLNHLKDDGQKIDLTNDFVKQYIDSFEMNEEQYRATKEIAKVVTESKQHVFIYATGFMGFIAEYLAKKLLVLGVDVIYSDGADSIGVFENHIEDISLLIVLSRSGRSANVINRIVTAKENGICTAAITGDNDSPLSQNCNMVVRVQDDNPYDDRNQKPTLFFAKCMFYVELLIYEYYRVLLHKN